MSSTNQRPASLPLLPGNIDPLLRTIERWVLWRYVRRGDTWTKVPYREDGAAAKTNQESDWTSFDRTISIHAASAGTSKPYDGIGFVFSDKDDLVGIDLDDCIDPASGEYSAVALELLGRIEGYAEVSPSGTGIKLFTRAQVARAQVDHAKGIEVYPNARFFTVTGHRLEGHAQVPAFPQDISWFLQTHFGAASAPAISDSTDALAFLKAPLDGWDITRVDAELLAVLDPDAGYADWINVGMALHHQFGGDPEALALWDSWSAQGAKYVAWECDQKWRSFGQVATRGRHSVTLATLIWRVRQQGLKQALASGRVVLDPRAPMDCARELVEHKFTGPDHVVLRHFRGVWYEHVETHYREVEGEKIRSVVWYFLDAAHRLSSNGLAVPFRPGMAHVNATIDALKAVTHFADARPPMWMDGTSWPDPQEVVSLKNGLFHIPTKTLLPHTAAFFTLNTLPFDWDQSAQATDWHNFLQTLWPDDQEAIDTVQEMLGYLITADTSMQKIFMLIGPKRSGKGTIGRVIDALLGSENITGPTLSSLTQNFGLQPLIGKLVAVIADARSPETGRQQVVERLLMMSGEDLITVDRKNKEAWVGNLTARVVIMTNEALQLGDASGALVGRLIVIRLLRSFYGNEDRTLTARLLAELPGIFNWSLEGRDRLYARGHFVQPASGSMLIEEMGSFNSPISEFLEERCECDPDYVEDRQVLFRAWIGWCGENGRTAGAKATFIKQLLAADPTIGITRPRAEDGDRPRMVRGLRLKGSKGAEDDDFLS